MNAALILRVLICAAAAYRVARIIAVDKITLPVRKWLFGAGWPDGPESEPLRPWNYLYNLVSCAYCAGFWFSLLAWWVWSWGGFAITAVCAVAVAGVQAQLSSFDKAANNGT